jgi:hypothetical protein
LFFSTLARADRTVHRAAPPMRTSQSRGPRISARVSEFHTREI